MFEIVSVVLFIWLMGKAIGLAFKLTWGVAKVAATLLMVVAAPLLFVCLFFVGGLLVLVPLALVGIAIGIVKLCT